MALADTDVLVVDCQSTGATPALGSLLEIAWANGHGVEAHRVALPHGHRVPRIVAELTGHTEPRPVGSVSADEAWRLLRAAAGERAPRPTVIDFARFELGFLRDLHAHLEPDAPFPLDVVCTHAIARRLLPGLPRRSLRALAGYFGLGVATLRRASDHVEATVFVWQHLARALEAAGVADWLALRAWLESPAPSSRGSRVYPLPRDKRLALPDAPGVYRMLRGNGDVLYVGKATSLKHRVSSHFTRGGRAHERALELLSQVRDVDVTETATALEAAVLETDEIKRLIPPYNVQLRGADRFAWFARADLANAIPAPDGAHRLGPLPSVLAVAPLGAVLAIAGGAEASDALRARAVNAGATWGPPAGIFAAGWRVFAEKHLGVAARSAEGRIARAAAAFARAADIEEERDDDAPAWDPARVVRRLERALAQGSALLRRARWLCLLADSVVAFRDSPGPWRVLTFERAVITTQGEIHDGAPLPPPPPARPWKERQAGFHAASYDRMRVVATELRRLEARVVVVTPRGATELSGARLARLVCGT